MQQELQEKLIEQIFSSESLNKIYKDVNNYLKSNNLSIKYIVPIMHCGGIPAIKFFHMFKCYRYVTNKIKT